MNKISAKIIQDNRTAESGTLCPLEIKKHSSDLSKKDIRAFNRLKDIPRHKKRQRKSDLLL